MHHQSPLLSLPDDFESRWRFLDALIRQWYGEVDSDGAYTLAEIERAGEALGVPIPEGLSRWYVSSGNLEKLWSSQDRFLPPDELYIDNDALIFYVENQAVVRWGIPMNEIADPDPSVVVSSVDDASVWIPQTEYISRFAIYMFAYVLAFYDKHSWICGYAEEPLVQSILNSFPRLEFPDQWWTGTRLFGYDDLIIAIDSGNTITGYAQSDTAVSTFVNLTSPDNFDVHASSWE